MFQELVFALVALTGIFVMVLFWLTWYWRKLRVENEVPKGKEPITAQYRSSKGVALR